MDEPTDLPEDAAELAAVFQKYWPETFAEAWSEVSSQLGIDLVFDLTNPLVQEQLPTLYKRIVGISETTEEELREIGRRALEEGISIQEHAQRILEHGEIRSVTRAHTIAATETATAYEMGAHAAYVQSGVVSGTEWLLGPDPCPECQPLGGKVVALGDEFAPGVRHAPAHPSCRCATAPVLS